MSNVITNEILAKLEELFPDAKCELDYKNIYELSIAVILSAQTTDIRVNMVTPKLFNTYKTINELAGADVLDVENIIRTVGLFKMKARNIILFARKVISDFQGEIPSTLDELITLPGIGRKTANVILSVGFNLPGLAVDTHVSRVAKRLGLVKEEDDVLDIEMKLKELFEESDWGKSHHYLLFFGRYLCMAKKPLCDTCPFTHMCTKK